MSQIYEQLTLLTQNTIKLAKCDQDLNRKELLEFDGQNEKSHKDEDEDVINLPRISRHDVMFHSDYLSCWIIINDRVYDVTDFIKEHPGGNEIILEHGGGDATMAFKEVGHSMDAIYIMKKYCIGVLDEEKETERKSEKMSL